MGLVCANGMTLPRMGEEGGGGGGTAGMEHEILNNMKVALKNAGGRSFERKSINEYTVEHERRRLDCIVSHYYGPCTARGACKH